jgi:hypothetical protein
MGEYSTLNYSRRYRTTHQENSKSYKLHFVPTVPVQVPLALSPFTL